MKNSRNIKQAVFVIGFIALLLGAFGAIADQSVIHYFLPIHAGFMFMGMAVLHKEETTTAATQKLQK